MLARTQSRFHDVRVRLENYVPRTAGGRLFWALFVFGFKEGWACLFGGALLALLLLSQWLWPAGAALTRYGGRPARWAAAASVDRRGAIRGVCRRCARLRCSRRPAGPERMSGRARRYRPARAEHLHGSWGVLDDTARGFC